VGRNPPREVTALTRYLRAFEAAAMELMMLILSEVKASDRMHLRKVSPSIGEGVA
jgi:hypothetical protein